jgi:hypothetical protein
MDQNFIKKLKAVSEHHNISPKSSKQCQNIIIFHQKAQSTVRISYSFIKKLKAMSKYRIFLTEKNLDFKVQ